MHWVAAVIVLVVLLIAGTAVYEYSKQDDSVCQRNGVYVAC